MWLLEKEEAKEVAILTCVEHHLIGNGRNVYYNSYPGVKGATSRLSCTFVSVL